VFSIEISGGFILALTGLIAAMTKWVKRKDRRCVQADRLTEAPSSRPSSPTLTIVSGGERGLDQHRFCHG